MSEELGMMANQHTPTDGNTNDAKAEKALDNWLPITASRKAKWWYAAFHNVTAVVGAGVLGLPSAVAHLGWIPGVSSILVAWLITLYTFWQLVQLHEAVPGRRFDRYTELGQYAFGKRLGLWVVMPQQLVVQVASTIIYMVTGGKSLQKAFDILFPSHDGLRVTYFTIIFAGFQLVLSQIPNFNSLKVISLAAAVMSISYSTIASAASIARGIKDNTPVRYDLPSKTMAGKIFHMFNSFGTIAFAFAAHSVALEIQATIPSTLEKPSKKPMWRGVIVSYVIVAFCYFSVAISGFWAFGDLVDDDVLVTLDRPPWLICAANFMVFVHVIGSYQVFAMPVFDKIECYLVKKQHFTPGRPLRLIARSLFVVVTTFIGVCVPFFGGLLGFFGGLAFTATSFFIPGTIWLIIQKPKRWSFHWIACWVSIIIGILVTLVAPIGGARTIIMSAKSYKMFS